MNRTRISRSDRDELARLENKIDVARKNLSDKRCSIVDKLSPVRIGDTVEVNGYSHKGKRMVVRSVHLVKRFGSYSIHLKGQVLKKDGSVSMNVADSYVPVE